MAKNKHAKKMLIFFGIVLLLFISLFVAFYVYETVLLSGAKAVAVKKGLFMTSLQINETYGANAKEHQLADLYDRITSLYVPPPADHPDISIYFGLKDRLYYNQRISPPQLYSIRELLSQNQSFLDAYDKLKGIQDIRFMNDFSNPDYHRINTECLNALRISNLYYLRTEVKLLDNKTDEIIADIRRMTASDDFAANLPFKVANDLFVSNIRLIGLAVNRAVNTLSFNDKQCRALIDTLTVGEEKFRENQKTILMGIASEFFIQLNSGKRYATGSDQFWANLKENKPLLRMERKITSWPGFDDFNEKLVMLSEIIELYDLLENYATRTPDETFWRNFNRGREGLLLLKNLNAEKFYQNNIRALNKLHIQATLVACLLYERQHFQFPENVEALTSTGLLSEKMGIDPYSGNPLQITYDRSLNQKGIHRLIIRSQDPNKETAAMEDATSTSYIISGTWTDDIPTINKL